jgi:hypothetical protein
MGIATKLALLGGPKAVTIEDPEQWRPPYEREIELCAQVIRERSFSRTDAYVCAEFERRFREEVITPSTSSRPCVLTFIDSSLPATAER